MKKRKDILVIDDEPVIIDAVNKICSIHNFNVAAAIDFISGMKLLDDFTFEIILCDVMLPDISGIEFLEKIYSKNIESPVIMMTGYSTSENAVKSLATGAIDFLPKPFTEDELLSTIYRAFQFAKIKKNMAKINDKSIDSQIQYVSCPIGYYCLGYSTWQSKDADGTCLIGITDLFLKTINSPQNIELFSKDEEVAQGNTCAVIETNDGLKHNIYSPISGRILETNILLVKNLSPIEKSPYSEGWFYRLIPSDLGYEMKYLIQSDFN